jgi:hypothetical protein
MSRLYTPRGQEFYHNLVLTRFFTPIDAMEASFGDVGSKEREATWGKVRDEFKLLTGF